MTATAVEDWLLDRALAPTADDDLLAPLYRAASRNELALPFCAACALALELDQEVCDSCGATERDWRTVDPTRNRARGDAHAPARARTRARRGALPHRRRRAVERTPNGHDHRATRGHRTGHRHSGAHRLPPPRRRRHPGHRHPGGPVTTLESGSCDGRLRRRDRDTQRSRARVRVHVRRHLPPRNGHHLQDRMGLRRA